MDLRSSVSPASGNVDLVFQCSVSQTEPKKGACCECERPVGHAAGGAYLLFLTGSRAVKAWRGNGDEGRRYNLPIQSSKHPGRGPGRVDDVVGVLAPEAQATA